MFEIYKTGQGKYTRLSTFIGVMAVVVIGAYILSGSLVEVGSIYVRYGVPTAIVLAAAWLMYWAVNRPKNADFLIATEGEMKKVSWSSRKEIVGSTKVVIVTTVILASILAGVDFVLAVVFHYLGIMGGAS